MEARCEDLERKVAAFRTHSLNWEKYVADLDRRNSEKHMAWSVLRQRCVAPVQQLSAQVHALQQYTQAQCAAIDGGWQQTVQQIVGATKRFGASPRHTLAYTQMRFIDVALRCVLCCVVLVI